MLAASQAPILALALLLLHGAAMSLPMLLLRPRVVPADVRDWLHPLPIPPALERRACAAVACLLLAPLALAYMASLAIWLYQAPAWLLPARAAAGTVLSFLFTWLCAAWLLARAGGPPRAARKPAAVATAAAYIARPRHGWFYLWCQLFWLPLWRKGALAGLRQAALLLAACIAFPAWMTGPSFMPRALGAVLASVLLVLLAHEADTQLRSQAGRVRAAAAAWPLDAGKLAWHARALLLLGFGCALLLVAAGGAWHGRPPACGCCWPARHRRCWCSRPPSPHAAAWRWSHPASWSCAPSEAKYGAEFLRPGRAAGLPLQHAQRVPRPGAGHRPRLDLAARQQWARQDHLAEAAGRRAGAGRGQHPHGRPGQPPAMRWPTGAAASIAAAKRRRWNG
jgi:hypothetical protein